MKKIKRLVVLVLALLLIVSGAEGGVFYAEGMVSGSDAPPEVSDGNASPEEPENNDPTPPEAPAPEAVSIAIDSKNVYEGMDRSYEKGYIPTVAEGKALIVVPIISTGQIKGSTLKTKLALGDTQSMPFVCKNFEKDVELAHNKVNGTENTVESYLITYELELKGDRYNGSYPVVLNIRAEDASGTKIEENITVYVNITDGKKPGGSTVSTPAPTFEPKVLVHSYHYSKDEIMAGDEITASITLLNTSKTNSVKNMTVTISADEQYLSLLSTTDTVYIEKIGPGKEYTVSFDYEVSNLIPEGQYVLNLAMNYADTKGAGYSSSGSAKINITQPVNVQFDPVYVPEKSEVSDVIELTVNAMNLGKGRIYNVRATVDMDGFRPDGTIFIGNVEAGSMASSSASVTVTGLSGQSSYGFTEGTITFLYEDESGNEYSSVQKIATEITSPFVASESRKEQDDPSQWWVITGIIAAVLVGYSVSAVIPHIKKKIEEKDGQDEAAEESPEE